MTPSLHLRCGDNHFVLPCAFSEYCEEILAISVFGATIKKDPFAESGRLGNQLKSLKSELAECEQTIIDAQAEIAAAQ